MYDIFSLADFKFPENFIWGSATAGHQIEGNNIHSQRWFAEQNGKIVDPDGKSFEIPEKSGMACDSYTRFQEDSKILADLGHQIYRFSLEWARIEPREGQFDEKEISHYLELIESLKNKGIKICVTLCHFSVPQWFHELGTFSKRENLRYFLRYCEHVIPRIKDYVDYWCVLNEVFGRGDIFAFNCIRAHAEVYHLIKSHSDKPVTSAHAAGQQYPQRPYDELDCIMAKYHDARQNLPLLHAIKHGELIAPHMDAEACPEAKNAMDFWGINIYTRSMVDSRKANASGTRYPHRHLKMLSCDFYLDEIYPEGTTAMLQRYNDRPVIITENGCSCDDDRFRIVYIALYLSAIKDAILNGVDIRGYLYWSLLDNYEWTSFIPRFGLVDVDFKTFKRNPKPSAFFFKEIIENNGFTQKILRKYLKSMPSLQGTEIK